MGDLPEVAGVIVPVLLVETVVQISLMNVVTVVSNISMIKGL